MIEQAGCSEAVYNAIGIILSINIIFWFSLAIYYNIKRILFYKRTTGAVFFTTYFNSIVSLLFVIIFLYIAITTIMGQGIIDNASFGAIVVRPLILLEAVGTAINEKEKYRRKEHKFL